MLLRVDKLFHKISAASVKIMHFCGNKQNNKDTITLDKGVYVEHVIHMRKCYIHNISFKTRNLKTRLDNMATGARQVLQFTFI